MPVYTYKCPACGRVQTAFRPIERRDRGPFCQHPVHAQEGPEMQRQLDAPMGIVDGPAVPRGSA